MDTDVEINIINKRQVDRQAILVFFGSEVLKIINYLPRTQKKIKAH
jgi:hypothetical protein